MDDLTNIPIVRQKHPGISPTTPLDVVREYIYQPMKEFKADMHYALQFCIILHGGAEVVFDGFQREYQAGEMWWTMCWEPHAYRFAGRRNFAVAVNIDLDQLGNCDPFGECNWLLPFVLIPSERYCPSDTASRDKVQNTGRQLFKVWNKRESNWKLESWLLIHQLILVACKNKQSASLELTGGFKKIKNAVDLVKSTVGRPPSLTEAAATCGLSPSRFSEVFRQNTGVSFGKFAARARLSFAAHDLKSGALTVEEVSEKWKFFDNSHFCHAFKELYGYTPMQFKKIVPKKIRTPGR
ncbi:MAG: AraC family transcriptional regulator [Verrucomicrobia bacterium]|nr:AraC family transcriptional regulator [Verrucomicrobiota bacterium]